MADADDYSDAAFWENLLQRDARESSREIDRILTAGKLDGDARLFALRAAARCHFELGQMESARRAATDALEASATSPVSEARRLAILTTSIIVAETGDTTSAIAELGRLEQTVRGVWIGRVRVQKACVMLLAGRTNDALSELDASAPILDEHGDASDRWRVPYNRGYALLHQGRLEEAEVELVEAQTISDDHDLTLFSAQTAATRGVLCGRARRLREAVEHFQLATELFERCGRPGRTVAYAEIDRSEVLMHSGLFTDAVASANAAIAVAAGSGNRTALGDSQLVLARAELGAGRFSHAERAANDARQTFTATGRRRLEAHAAAVSTQARLLGRRRESWEALDAESRAALRVLEADGWTAEERHLRLARVRAARRRGVVAAVTSDLARLGSAESGSRNAELDRAFARAIQLQLDGSTMAARERAIAGIDLVDEIVAEAGSLAERSAAMSIGHDLSQLVIDLSIELADAQTVFAAAEGTRARALHDELGGSERHRPLTAGGAERLESALRNQLGDRRLIEWIVSGDRVRAVIVEAEGIRLIDVGPEQAIRRACDRVQTWLDVAASEPDEDPERARTAFGLLDEVLMLPLEIPPTADIVIVPDGFLHSLPWAGLPTCARRGFTVAPSGQLWLQAERDSTSTAAEITAIIGPDVDSEDTERSAVMALAHHARVIDTASASSDALRTALAGDGLVHLAAHGTFRSDRPLLSTVRLADGETAVDAALPAAIGASVVVLSSCEAGASGTSDGSEVLGLAALLLSRGGRSIVAPLTIVRDLDCAQFVAEVYDEFGSGMSIGSAMAHTRRRWLNSSSLGRLAVAASFLCVGSSSSRVRAGDGG